MVTVTVEEPANVRLLFNLDLESAEGALPLTIDEIEIYENGALLSSLESQAQIQNEPGEFLFSTLLLLDLSGSVLNDEDDLNQVKDATRSFVELVMPADTTDPEYGVRELGIYWFDGEEEIHVLEDYSFSRDSLLMSIDSIRVDMSTDRSTNLNGAVIEGVLNMQDKITGNQDNLSLSTVSTLVLFTDGIDLAGRQTEEGAFNAIDMLTNQYQLYTIGLGEDIDKKYLRDIGKNGYEFPETANDLNVSFINIAEQVNVKASSFYALEYCSPKRSGNHMIQVRTYMDEKVGRFDTEFAADGFIGGCVID